MAADAVSARRCRTTARSRSRGFTLIELMIAVTIVAILAAIAIPSYQNSVRKTRRVDAKAALTETAQRLERCLTQYGTYDNGNCTVAATFNSPESFYLISADVDTMSYALSAAAQGAQSKDVACTRLALDHRGARTAFDVTGNAAADCW